jgi:hypothetical protein
MMRYKYGKKPARPGAARLMLSDYLDTSALPAPPQTYGHENVVTDWGMLANGPDPSAPDIEPVGDCAIAAPLHAIRLWHAETGVPVNITPQSAIANYSAITGYDPSQTDAQGNNPTDQGTDVQQMLECWRTTGLVDGDGNRHQIAAYVGLSLPNLLDELWYADYLLDGVIIGINCPAQYQDAFSAGQPWDALPDPNYEGGHCVLMVGKPNADHDTITWGGKIPFAPAGITQNVDEAWAVLSQERVNSGGVDVNGFAYAKLLSNIPLLAQVS